MPEAAHRWLSHDATVQALAQRLSVPPENVARWLATAVRRAVAHQHFVRACALALDAVLTDTPDPGLCQRARRAFRRACSLNHRLRRAALEVGFVVVPARLRQDR
jgi:hypothetical protein